MNIHRTLLVVSFFLGTALALAGPDSRPVLSAAGLDVFKFGMNLDTVNSLLKHKIVLAPVESRANPVCDYVPVADLDGVSFVFIGDQLQRIDISKPTFASIDNAFVGSKEEEVIKSVGNAHRERLPYYPDGMALIKESSSSQYALSYQFYDGRLQHIVAGNKLVIRYAEGCE